MSVIQHAFMKWIRELALGFVKMRRKWNIFQLSMHHNFRVSMKTMKNYLISLTLKGLTYQIPCIDWGGVDYAPPYISAISDHRMMIFGERVYIIEERQKIKENRQNSAFSAEFGRFSGFGRFCRFRPIWPDLARNHSN